MPLRPVTWFVCRSLGRSVVAALRGAGEDDVRHHDDHFAPDAPDAEWLPAVAKHGWVMLSKDKRIRRRAHERDPFLAVGGRAFFLAGGNLSGAEQCARIVRALPQMRKMLRATSPPFLAVIGARDVTVVGASAPRARR